MPDTELDRARVHLLKRQLTLADTRILAFQGALGEYAKASVLHAETTFLAALSWVWDAQERAAAADHAGWFAGLKALPSCLSSIDPDVRAIIAQTQFTEFDRNEFARRLMPAHTAQRKETARRFAAIIGQPPKIRAKRKRAKDAKINDGSRLAEAIRKRMKRRDARSA